MRNHQSKSTGTRSAAARRRSRSGSSVVELVLTIPIIFLLTFGSIEACNLNHLQQSVTETAYQGALIGMSYGADEATITNGMTAMVNARGISGATYSVKGLDGVTPFADVPSGDSFVVTVNIPSSANLPMSAKFVTLPDLESSMVCRKP